MPTQKKTTRKAKLTASQRNAALTASRETASVALLHASIGAAKGENSVNDQTKALIGGRAVWVFNKELSDGKGAWELTPCADEARELINLGYLAARFIVEGTNQTDADAEAAAVAMARIVANKAVAKLTADEKAARASARKLWSRTLVRIGKPRPKHPDAKERSTAAKAPTGEADKPKPIEISAADAAAFMPPNVADLAKACEHVEALAARELAWSESINQKLMATDKVTLPLGYTSALGNFAEEIEKARKARLADKATNGK